MTRFYLKTRIVAAVALIAIACSGMMPLPVASADCQKVSVTIDEAGTTCVPINNSSTQVSDNPIFFYLKNFLYFLAGGVGLAVVGGIVAGAYMYITARANAAQTQKGQTMILNSVIALFLFIFMYAILQFLIPGGIFT